MNIKSAAGLLLCGLLAIPGQVIATDKIDPQDQEARTILGRALDTIENFDRFQIRGETVTDVMQESGQKLQFGSEIMISLQRPDKLSATRQLDDGSHRHLFYNGKTLTLWAEEENVYAQTEAPETIDTALDFLETELDHPQPLSDLLYSDLSPLVKRPIRGVVVGTSVVGEVSCIHLAFIGEGMDWQIWVDQGEQPLIRKVVLTYKSQPGAPQHILLLNRWDTPDTIPATTFEFQPPPEAERIKLMVAPRADLSTEGGRK